MKILFPLFLLLLAVASCSSEPEFMRNDTISDLFTGICISDELNLYVDKEGNSISGEYSAYFNDGTPRAELIFENGMVISGETWLKSGILLSSFTVEDGLYKKTLHLEDGNPMIESYYGEHLNDRQIFNGWFDNGKPFVQNSRTMARMWHEKGQLATESPLVDGKMHGKALAWHENGEIAAENHFEDDEMHGSFRRWDENGNLISEKVYDMGVLVSE